MSAISDFATKMNEHNAAMDVAVEGLQGDITTLNNEIASLKASEFVSAEDRATLASLEARGKSIADKLAALDALTPPAPPSE